MLPEPILLAFDTSAAHCAAAVVVGDTCRASVVTPMAKGQAENLFPILKAILTKTGVAWPDLTAIAVCTGPGNFTGVRISVSAARGLALSLGIPAVGVSRLDAMAYQTMGVQTALIDARQNRAYHQTFENGAPITNIEQKPIKDFQSTDSILFETGVLELIGTELQTEKITENLAHCAMSRLNMEITRPAPIYIRAADAALPSDPPPMILP